jgi:hypothetical protein
MVKSDQMLLNTLKSLKIHPSALGADFPEDWEASPAERSDQVGFS